VVHDRETGNTVGSSLLELQTWVRTHAWRRCKTMNCCVILDR